MPDPIRYEDDDLFNPETHHESSDVPVRPLLWFIVWFIVFGIVTHFLMLFLYKGLASLERNRMQPPQTQVARPADADVPKNQPLLQPFPRVDEQSREIAPTRLTPVTDMQTMRAAQEQVLNSYGWIDRQNDVAHIPIAEAKKRLVAELAVKGQTAPGTAAPATTTAPAPAAVPGTTPGASAGTPASQAATGAASPAPAAVPPPGGGTQ